MNGMEHVPQTPQATEPSTAASPAISDAIEKLLAHPELLSSVASAIGLGKPSAPPQAVVEPQSAPPPSAPVSAEGEVLPSAAPTPSADLGEAVAAIAPLLSAFSGKGGDASKANDPRSCLLRALKPYVSHGRAEAIDTIIRLSLISETLKKFNEKGG